ncbi:hypothetical protein P4G36_27940 (plasmid) [Escherichia coli]|uniref:type II secretion system protein n=1 Tax=Enterobacteriaceae TaxID=543 RepID=UPI0009730187|nr:MULTISPECIES: hypothetical protein [Enterobacteriaceae]MDS1455451.1 hypothetical protein [Escherichia coli]MDS1461135.1 hypothetical protein [Escherichia coli]SJA38521.1 Bundle-forming pilin [Shigella sonnei]SJG87701.1 Bundle-forming pilin [Shigella sonnei]
MIFYQKTYQKGLSLIEASMVLVLSAVVIVGAMAYYQSASDNKKMDKLSSILSRVASSVSVLYANNNNGYRGLDATLVSKLNPGIGKIDSKGRLVLPTGNGLRVVGNYDYLGQKIWYFTVDDIYPQQCASILFAMLHMNKAANSPVLWYSYNGNWNDWTEISPSNARVDKICNAEFETINISMGFN